MLYLASDHAGFEQKEYIAHELARRNIAFEDFGSYSDEPTDFPKYAKKSAQAVLRHHGRAILFCGSGVGMCVAANRYKHIRAFTGWNKDVTVRAREEDDVNILCIPSRLISNDEAWEVVSTFLSTTFLREPRYKRRLEQIDEG
ncbi:RpiB/LacA/LacB family sugar-phosphate isomerase [Candidatus Berkelbacteria bacterium]|nr:RpiB/LacA/LacB family sugar-phosphate isomerase [Candidatus Berkelbacteria bacterium]